MPAADESNEILQAVLRLKRNAQEKLIEEVEASWQTRMRLPSQPELPFFAYGIFQPGQLGYLRIQELVCGSEPNCQVSGELWIRDGLPILKSDGEGLVRGTILSFQPNASEKAYQRIVDIEPDRQYHWGVLLSGSRSVNVLLGKFPKKGGRPAETLEWDGKTDPLFTSALDVVSETLNANPEIIDRDLKPTFRLQMAYLLLWSSIERYVSLRYHLGGEAWKKVEHLAREPAFRSALEATVTKPREIFRADKPDDKCKLDASNPERSLKYYYQVRSNIVHRGKGIFNDHKIVRESLRELLAIFKAVKDEAFRLSSTTDETEVPSESPG